MKREWSIGQMTATKRKLKYLKRYPSQHHFVHHECLNWTKASAVRCQFVTVWTMAQSKTMMLSTCLYRFNLVLHQVLPSCRCITFVTPDCCLVILAVTNSIKPNVSRPYKTTIRFSYIYQAENSCSRELRPWHCSSAVPDGLGTPWLTSLRSLCSYFGIHHQHSHRAAAETKAALCPNATSSTSMHLHTINLNIAIHH